MDLVFFVFGFALGELLVAIFLGLWLRTVRRNYATTRPYTFVTFVEKGKDYE